jgi:hypothetical protein
LVLELATQFVDERGIEHPADRNPAVCGKLLNESHTAVVNFGFTIVDLIDY